MALETEHRTLDPQTVRRGVGDALRNPAHGRYFVAEDDTGTPLGQLMVTYEWSDWRNGQFWWFQSVYVLPAARRRGVFRRCTTTSTRLSAQHAGRLRPAALRRIATIAGRSAPTSAAACTTRAIASWKSTIQARWQRHEGVTMLKNGTQAPEFDLEDQNGKRHTLKSLLGPGR